MKRNNLRKISIGLITMLFAVLAMTNVDAADYCENYKGNFVAKDLGSTYSKYTVQKVGGAYRYWKYNASYPNTGISGLAFCIDPSKSGWNNNNTGHCSRVVDPYSTKAGNVQKFDRAITYLYEKNDLSADYEASDLAVKFLAYYYDHSFIGGNLYIKGSEYYNRSISFTNFATALKKGNYTADCGKNYVFCDKSGSKNSSLNKAIAMANEAINKAKDDSLWQGTSAQLSYQKNENENDKTTVGSSENAYWTFYNASGSKISATQNGTTWNLNGYNGAFSATTIVTMKLGSDFDGIDESQVADKFTQNYKINCGSVNCAIDSSYFQVDSNGTARFKIKINGNTSSYSGGTATFSSGSSNFNKTKGDIIVLTQGGEDTRTDTSSLQRYIAFLNGDSKVKANAGGINITLPKLTTSGYSCQIVNNKYYNKTGKEVSKSEYETDCPSGYSCQIVNNKYYNKDGKEVSKSEYEKDCPSNQCGVKNGKYYGPDGDTVTKTEYEKLCACSTKIRMFNACYEPGDKNSKINGTLTSRITGPRNVYGCFFDPEQANGDDEYEKSTIVDEAKNTYKLSNRDDAAGITDNKYCSVYCKEDYVLKYPTTKNVNAGEYFKLKLNIHGEKTCYEKIYVDEFNSDVQTQQQAVINAYNKYRRYKAIEDQYDKSSTNICGGKSFNVSYSILNSNGTSSTNSSLTAYVGRQQAGPGCASTSDDYERYEFSNEESLEKYVNQLKSEFTTANSKLEDMKEDIKSCSIYTSNDGWDSGVDTSKVNSRGKQTNVKESEIEKWYNPVVEYDYQTNYKGEIIKRNQNFDEDIDGEIEVWSCDGNLNGNEFDSCSTTTGTKINTTTRNILKCSENSCSTESVRVPTTKYFKVTSSVDAEYISKTLYSTKYPTGELYNKVEDEKGWYNNNYNIENGIPVSLSEEDGLHKYWITIDKLGRYYNDDEGSVGRLINSKNENKSVFGRFEQEADYVCTYIVNGCPEYVRDAATDEECCITDAQQDSDGNYYCGCIKDKDSEGNVCCEDEIHKDENGNKYCGCDLVVDKRDNVCCDYEIKQEPDGSTTCTGCTEYTDEDNVTCCEEDTVNGKCCPECDVYCFCPNGATGCKQVDDYTCVFGKDEEQCNGEDCPVECIGGNCIVSNGGKQVNYSMRSISLNNINANESDENSNWDNASDKVKQTIDEIQQNAANKTENLEYKFVLSTEALNAIREGNKDESWVATYKERDDFDVDKDTTLICEPINNDTEHIFCTSRYLDWLAEQVGGGAVGDNNEVFKYRFDKANSKTYTEWKTNLADRVGPAWK